MVLSPIPYRLPETAKKRYNRAMRYTLLFIYSSIISAKNGIK